MQTELRQEPLAAPVDRAALKAELTPYRKVRDTPPTKSMFSQQPIVLR